MLRIDFALVLPMTYPKAYEGLLGKASRPSEDHMTGSSWMTRLTHLDVGTRSQLHVIS